MCLRLLIRLLKKCLNGTASKKAESMDEAPNVMYVITAADIQKKGFKNLKDVLQPIPGFDLFLHELGQNVQVRGLAANENEKSFWSGHMGLTDGEKDRWTILPGKEYRGVITRITWWPDETGRYVFHSPPARIKMRDITDGTSQTMVIGEKFIPPSRYKSGDWCDDCGWSDGWDPDTLRSSTFIPMMDKEGTSNHCYRFGSAHPGVFNAVFADGSTQSLSYEIDPFVFNYLGNRQDGEVLEEF